MRRRAMLSQHARYALGEPLGVRHNRHPRRPDHHEHQGLPGAQHAYAERLTMSPRLTPARNGRRCVAGRLPLRARIVTVQHLCAQDCARRSAEQNIGLLRRPGSLPPRKELFRAALGVASRLLWKLNGTLPVSTAGLHSMGRERFAKGAFLASSKVTSQWPTTRRP